MDNLLLLVSQSRSYFAEEHGFTLPVEGRGLNSSTKTKHEYEDYMPRLDASDTNTSTLV